MAVEAWREPADADIQGARWCVMSPSGQDGRENVPRLTRQLVVRVDEMLYRALVNRAQGGGVSMGEYVRGVLRREVER